MQQSLTLLLAITIGTLVPWFAQFAYLIAPLLVVMMFFSFLGPKNISYTMFLEKKVWWVFLANICIGILAYFAVLPFGKDLAFIAFIVGMIPTALAAPAVVTVLKGRVEMVIACVFVTNFGVALLLPFMVKYLTGTEIIVIDMLIKISLLLLPPLFVTFFIRKFFPKIREKILEKKSLVFYLWGSIIILAMSRASEFLHLHWDQYSSFLLPIALFTAIICAVNFTVGHWIGGKKNSKEMSQSLGQKNPMFMIWVSLSFFSPVVALGPTFYIFFHNLVNAYKLMKNKT